MNELELEARRLKLQQWGIYISIASLLLGVATLYLNTRSSNSSKN
jgi:hypothetical protein